MPAIQEFELALVVDQPPAAPLRIARITDLDLIKYDLLFERFLNLPYFNARDRHGLRLRYRDEMIRYAAEKYGRDHVAQIITFGTIKARNAVRDAGESRLSVRRRNAAKAMPLVMGRDTPLKYCFEENEKYADGYKAASEIRAMYESDDDVKSVIDVAKGLEGLKRSDGIHAAAVVITKEPVTEYLPIQRKPESGKPPKTHRWLPSTKCNGSKLFAQDGLPWSSEP